jgi:hypothetical protein
MYEELIAVLDDLDIALDNGFGKASTFIACTKATRKVIELHRPATQELLKDVLENPWLCVLCMESYPCRTVQAIAEELK